MRGGAARALLGEDAFVEVFVDMPPGVCEARDAKGLYRRARAGALAGLTGVDAPYEAPEAAELALDGAGECPDALARRVMAWLESADGGR